MGEVINFSERKALLRARAPRQRRDRSHAEYFFDLGCPFTYLAAERVERAVDHVTWTPASAGALRGGQHAGALGARAFRRAAEERAAALRLPLVWPERFPAGRPGVMRAAALAAERGRGGPFVLAATRLAFCGGFDLGDAEVLAEAAAAAGLPVEDCRRAAADAGRDAAIEDAGRRVLAAGADRLPALQIDGVLHAGERRVGDAVVVARAVRVARG